MDSSSSASASHQITGTRKGPLHRLAILELGNVIAAPMAGAMLADCGAHVVKVEQPMVGDDLRNWPPKKDGVSLWWKVTNRNKSLITLNLAHPDGQKLLLRVLPRFDVVIENFRPGTLEKWHLGYDRLAESNPKIVLVRISGYGQTGRYRTRPGYGTIAEAMSGIPAITGWREGPPTLSAFPLGDAIAGMFAVQAALMGVYERDRSESGVGQEVDVSLLESMFRLVDLQVIAYDQLKVVKERSGNRMEEDSPRNLYQTQDGRWIAISAGSQKTFARLAKAIGEPQLNDDPRFATTELRVANAVVLDTIVSEWFQTRTAADAMQALACGDVVAGPVYDVRDIFADPYFEERGDIVQVTDDDLGPVQMHGVIPKFGRTPGCVRKPGGRLGEDNETFYVGECGLSRDELVRFQADGVI